MPNPKCEACGKTAYPLESVTALEKTYHKGCFKCVVCKTTLNLKNFKGFEGQVYCGTHTPTVKATAVVDSVQLKAALNAPKKKAEGLSTAHRGDKHLEPQSTGDFTPIDSSIDQSTENAPIDTHIIYEAHSGDQSTENTPEDSGIHYETSAYDQSTENQPSDSTVTYDQHSHDQSTENDPQYAQPQYAEGEYQPEYAEGEYQEQQQ